MTTATLSRRQRPPARAASAALVAAAASALLWAVTEVAPLDWHPPDARLVLDGAHYRAGADELRWLEAFSSLHFDAGEEGARALVAAQVETHLDALFADAHARLPAFLDWYYSMRGEYSRVAMAALAQVNAAQGGFVAERATAMLLPDDVWDARLSALAEATSERLAVHHSVVRDAWRSAVAARLSEQRVPAPLAEADTQATFMLDELLGELAARETAALGTRVSLSTAAAGLGAAATPVLARAAAVRSGRAAASRAAARGASRIGAAAASGAAVCAPGGVVAAACALLAGGGAWLATDWALLQLDERRHRAELERSLLEALAALREGAELELAAGFDAVVTAHYADVRGEIRRTFVPAAAGRAAGSEREGS